MIRDALLFLCTFYRDLHDLAECEVGDFGFAGDDWGVGGWVLPLTRMENQQHADHPGEEAEAMRVRSCLKSPRFARRLRESTMEGFDERPHSDGE